MYQHNMKLVSFAPTHNLNRFNVLWFYSKFLEIWKIMKTLSTWKKRCEKVKWAYLLFKYEYEIESEVISAEKYKTAISYEMGGNYICSIQLL